MLFQRLATKVSVLAPAKINLFLELHGKRDDGFHELETVMVAVSLFDRLEFTPIETPEVLLDCQWEAGQLAQAKQLGEPSDFLGDFPPPEQNLVWRAVQLLRREERVKVGAKIDLTKRIPAASGFGGASSDAAAALVAANRAWNLHLPIEKLAAYAGQLGSDVPFFLYAGKQGTGQAVAIGRGEIIKPFSGNRLHLVLVRPAGGLSTAKVYQACRIPESPVSSKQLVQSLGEHRKPTGLVNRLQEPALQLSSTVQQVANVANRLEAGPHQMSGSGSGYFVVCRNQRHANQVAMHLRAAKLGLVFAVSSCGIRSLLN